MAEFASMQSAFALHTAMYESDVKELPDLPGSREISTNQTAQLWWNSAKCRHMFAVVHVCL